MDAVTITAGVGSLLVSVGKIVQVCNDFHTKYQIANSLLPAIAAECNLMKVGFTQIHHLMEVGREKYQDKGDLLVVLENSLAGCSVVLEVLCAEIGIDEPYSSRPAPTRIQRLGYAWSDTKMQELLAQLRGQQGSLTLIITILHSQSTDEVLELVQLSHRYLARMAQTARSYATSIRPTRRDSLRAETCSIFSFAEGSVISDTSFAFDDQIVSAEAYRRVMNQHANSQDRLPDRSKVPGTPGSSPTTPRMPPQQDLLSPRVPSQSSVATSSPSNPFSDGGATVGDDVSATTWSSAGQTLPVDQARRPPDIFSAIRAKEYDKLQAFIEDGLDLSERNDDGHSPLSEAVHLADAEACRILLKGGAGQEARCYAKSCHQATPVHIAAMRDSVEVIQVLLEHRANLSSQSLWNCNALHWAAENDAAEAATILLSKGLSLASKDAKANTPLHTAAMAKSEAFLQAALSHEQVSLGDVLQIKNADGRTPLQLIIVSWGVKGVRLLKSLGFDMEALNDEGGSLIHHAASQASHEAVRILITTGVDVNVRNATGMTPLHCAILSESESTRTIRILLDLGADLEARMHTEESRKWSTARLATDRDHPKGSIEADDDDDAFPAIHSDTPKGATVDDYRGLTPLLLAAKSSSLPVVQCLLDAGADLSETGACGCNALKLARLNDDPSVFECLLKALNPSIASSEKFPLAYLSFSTASDDALINMQNVLLTSLGLRELGPHNAVAASQDPDSCANGDKGRKKAIRIVEAAAKACELANISIYAIYDKYDGRSAIYRVAAQNWHDCLAFLVARKWSKEALSDIRGVKNELTRRAQSAGAAKVTSSDDRTLSILELARLAMEKWQEQLEMERQRSDSERNLHEGTKSPENESNYYKEVYNAEAPRTRPRDPVPPLPTSTARNSERRLGLRQRIFS